MDTQETSVKRLFYCCNVNYVPPEHVVAYRGEIVRYAYERERTVPVPEGPPQSRFVRWHQETVIDTAEHHIVLIVTTTGAQELLVNIDPASPAGYCHGYSGSGPHATALSVLAHFIGEHPRRGTPFGGLPLSHTMHGDFVRDYVACWPKDEGWELPRADLERWIAAWVRSAEGQDTLQAVVGDLQRQQEWDREDDAMWEQELAHDDPAWAQEYRRRRHLARLLGLDPNSALGRVFMNVDEDDMPPTDWPHRPWLVVPAEGEKV